MAGIPTFGKLAGDFPIQSQAWLISKIVPQSVCGGRQRERRGAGEEEGEKLKGATPHTHLTAVKTKQKKPLSKKPLVYFIGSRYILSSKHKILSHGAWMKLYSWRLGVGLFPVQCS